MRRTAALALCLLPALLLLLWLDGWLLAPWHGKTVPLESGAALVLRGSRLTLAAGDGPLWQTEPGWRVQDFLLGDIDRDGREELMVLLWRRGSFGKARPMWETGPDRAWSQHIFLYRLESGLPDPFWMSSALRPEVKDWAWEEGQLSILTRQGEATRWAWLSWGLERTDRPAVAI